MNAPRELMQDPADGDRIVAVIGGRSGTAPTASAQALGFKAFNLARMERMGLPVPQAFVLGTAFCRDWLRRGGRAPDDFVELARSGIAEVERASGLVFGGARRPLLVSVRSGAPVSMPGMMDTILDVGVNDVTVRGLIRLTGNPRLAWDSYRRFVQSFAEVVHGAPRQPFDLALGARVTAIGGSCIGDLDFEALEELARENISLFESLTGKPFPQQPIEQLAAAIQGVWASWSAPKAVEYRRLHGIPDDVGTAVTVQRMVYGNAGGTSGAGVAFTRDPATGKSRLYFDFLFNAQGEDVVSGRRDAGDEARLEATLPEVRARIATVATTLEREFRDLQEFEFTVQDGALFVLQTREGKRTPWAALQVAVDLAEEGLIDRDELARRIAAIDIGSLQRRRAVPGEGVEVLCRAVAANLGVATGAIALDPARACALAAEGRDVILVRADTTTEDIAGIAVAKGLLTATGGRTSHAAVVARQRDIACLVGCEALTIDPVLRRCRIGARSFAEGEVITLDGNAGSVLSGPVAIEIERPDALLARARALGAIPG